MDEEGERENEKREERPSDRKRYLPPNLPNLYLQGSQVSLIELVPLSSGVDMSITSGLRVSFGEWSIASTWLYGLSVGPSFSTLGSRVETVHGRVRALNIGFVMLE